MLLNKERKRKKNYCVISLTIQLETMHLFAQFKNQTVLFNLVIGPYHVDLEAIAMKGYSTFPKSPRIKPHHQIDLRQIQDTRWGVLPFFK